MSLKNLKPIEMGNAEITREVCLPLHPLILLRYEGIADFYSREPVSINIKKAATHDTEVFEQIFRVRKWIPNQKLCSWSIYCRNREVEKKLDEDNIDWILRNVIWDRTSDVDKVKHSSENEKRELLNSWPNITIRNVYTQSSSYLNKAFKELDEMISNGIMLDYRDQSNERPTWSDLEIMRLYDWGALQASWCPVKENKDLEEYVTKFSGQLGQIIESNMEIIYQMDLDYSYPTESYKNVIRGNI